jgi:hypothetical protein
VRKKNVGRPENEGLTKEDFNLNEIGFSTQSAAIILIK